MKAGDCVNKHVSICHVRDKYETNSHVSYQTLVGENNVQTKYAAFYIRQFFFFFFIFGQSKIFLPFILMLPCPSYHRVFLINFELWGCKSRDGPAVKATKTVI